jgi:putative tricarboxylic transport membrane protein
MGKLRCLILLLTLSGGVCSGEVERIHFLIPAGPGGGWDGTARGLGDALMKSGLVSKVSFENLSGGGGGRAIAKLIETAPRQQHTLMVSSTPIVIRSLQKIFPQSFRDLTPVAAVIADYGCFVVRKDSPFATWNDVVKDLTRNPASVKVAGGSVRGSTDHLVVAMAMKLAGADPKRVVYVAYDGGGKAMVGLLTGETQLLSTGFSEAVEMARSGEVRVLGVTSNQRLPDAPEIPTLKEQGYDFAFANWRGFFGPPGLQSDILSQHIAIFKNLIKTSEFEDIRSRNGWAVLFQPGQEFYNFLEQQEAEIGQMMIELGFLRER